MPSREDVARAMAFFEADDDISELHRLNRDIAPRVKQIVGRMLARGGEDAIPAPADLRASRQAATRTEAIATLQATDDFSLLQALARSIGQRIETIEIAASAQFPEGARVLVPGPDSQAALPGTVERTGTMLKVRLDNGETWEGSPSTVSRAGR